MKPTDELTALINRIRKGDEDAIVEMIRKHEPLVIKAIRFALEPGNSLRPFLTTNDILQSVNIRLIREARRTPSAEAGQPPREPISDGLGWLIIVATRLVIDRSRRLPKKPEKPDGPKVVSLDALAAILADPNPGPEEDVDNRDMVRFIQQQLSPEERAVLDARMAGQSWEETGEHLARSMQRRLKSLREQLQEPKNDESE